VKPPELTRLDPELVYLIQLTRAGLKPLSRWERSIDRDTRQTIQRQGLIVDTVARRTRLGRRRHETVFARKSVYTDLYRKRLDGTRFVDSPGVARFQGRLFGYPSCCVEAFVREPYAPNALERRDQEILFHWACPSCHTTPGLVREYRRVHREWRDVSAGLAALPQSRAGGVVGRVAASLGLAAGTAALATTGYNPHWWSTTDDMDRDGLSVSEEILIGSNWHVPDTDFNLVSDGVQWGTKLAEILELGNPLLEFAFTVYHEPLMGIYNCEVCGEVVNMGSVTVTNKGTGLSIQIPYMGVHALENGCTKYTYRACPYPCGVVSGQVDLDLLKRVLTDPWAYSYVFPHPAPSRSGDTDGDGLTDAEEVALGTDPDSGADGIKLAAELVSIIARLPRSESVNHTYMVEYEMDGVEQCEVCGGTFNMGHVDIVSPLDDMSVSVPYVALHAMAHGGFAYDGTHNDGEVLPLILRAVLTANGSAHWVALSGDADDDGLLDSEEAFFGLDPGDGDEDATGRGDGRELAARMAAKISALPEGPLPAETYAVHHRTRGFYNCLVCGEPIDMGYMEVVDPVAGKQVDLSYYSHHFMGAGSFSTDRDDLYPRVDPTTAGGVLGITTIIGVGDGAPAVPFSFVSAPNPFGPEGGTRISLALPAAGAVEVTVYDVKGRRVRTLFAGDASGSELNLRWDGTDDGGHAVGVGTYFCKARFGQVVVSRKLTLVR